MKEGREDCYLRSGKEFSGRARHRVRQRRQCGWAFQAAQGKAKNGPSPPREGRQRRAGGFQKKFAGKVEEKGEHSDKPLKILAFDEARFGLINWHRKRYCPKGFRPPYVVQRAYEWTYLYATVDPSGGESFSHCLPGMESLCF